MQDLGKWVGRTFSTGNHKESATCCKHLLHVIINDTVVEIATETKVPCLETSILTHLVNTKNQAFVRLTDDVTAQMVIELHSSPYEDTIRKCLIVATDLLCQHRMFHAGVKSVTTFTFPKLPTAAHTCKQCVVKVFVT